MSLLLYMDVNVLGAITKALRLRGVDVLTAQEGGRRRLSDPELVDRATSLDRVMFSHDADMLAEAAKRQRDGRPFRGVIHADQLGITIAQCIDELKLIARVYDPADIANGVEHLPLK